MFLSVILLLFHYQFVKFQPVSCSRVCSLTPALTLIPVKSIKAKSQQKFSRGTSHIEQVTLTRLFHLQRPSMHSTTAALLVPIAITYEAFRPGHRITKPGDAPEPLDLHFLCVCHFVLIRCEHWRISTTVSHY